MKLPLRRVRFAALVPLALAAFAPALAAQRTTADTVTSVAAAAQTISRERESTGPLLDVPISRTEYQLGPGDVVDVAVFGDLELLYTLSVNPEGTITVPSVGVARVLGLNLDQAQARVRDLVFRYYRNVQVTLTLTQVRTFKIYVLGQVPNPGGRSAAAVTRVSEVVPPLGAGGPRRNVMLRHTNGDSARIDLARFFLFGDLDSNPRLREGDVVVVPTVDRTVTVFGRVQYPGTYEFRDGESLASFLGLVTAGGVLPANAGDTIRVARFISADRQETIVMSSAEALGARGRAFTLQPFDAIFVPLVANFGVQRYAAVYGQVRRPGPYPIRPDTTTVRELVELAGGLTPEASLVGATLRRAPVDEGREITGDQLAPVRTLNRDEEQLVAIEARGDASAVVVDFQQLFAAGTDAYAQTVRVGDVVAIPQRREEVVVLGAVTRPGLVPFHAGDNIETYVNRAGGFTRRADWRGTTVLRGGTGTRIPAEDVTRLEPGDRIIVPFRERRTLLERLSTTSAVTSIISATILSVTGLVTLLTR